MTIAVKMVFSGSEPWRCPYLLTRKGVSVKPEAYASFIDQLTASLQADARVQGLVLLGSTANRSHPPDEWSDHDFFVVTASGQQEDFRTRFDWLPDHAQIVLTVRETPHGLKILYASGHLLEYAVFDRAEIAVARANDYVIAFDRGGVAQAMREIAATGAAAYSASSLDRDLGMFLCLLVVGAGRVARGEAISGQVFIRAYAVGHLLPVLAHALAAEDSTRLDNLDPLRRFEQVFPQVGAEVNRALDRPPLDAALALLEVCERHLRGVEAYPAQAAATVRDFLLRCL